MRQTETPASTPIWVYDAIEAYIGDDPAYWDAFERFLANRERLRKPVKTLRAINTIINRLRGANNREREIALLEEATATDRLTVHRSV